MASSSSRALFLYLTLMIFFFSFTLVISSTDGPCPPPQRAPDQGTCPRDTLYLGVCVDLLEGLLGLVGSSTPQKTPCCSLIEGLADLEASVCLCTAIKGSVLGGTNLDLPLALSLLLDYCDKNVPSDFQCA